MPESEKARSKRLQDGFKLDIPKWQLLESGQDKRCWICGAIPEGRRLATDHDWETGEVRGLLCGRCNTLLGKIERPNRGAQPWTLAELRRAIQYKENPPARAIFGAPHYGWPGDVTTKKHRKMLKRLKRNEEKARQILSSY